MAYRNIAEMFFDRAAVRGAKPRYRSKRDGAWQDTSWSAVADVIRETAAGMLDLGIQPGQKIALLSSTRPEWVEADLAVYACGGVSVPIYQSNLPHECGYILANSESRVCFVENPKQLEKIRVVQRDGFELDGTRCRVEIDHLILMDGDADGADVVTLATLRARGRETLPRFEGTLTTRLATVGRDDLATIVYTSGTTGPPKGVMQTHGNHLASVEAVAALGLAREGEVDFFFLPLAHSFARMIEYYGLWTAARSLRSRVDRRARAGDRRDAAARDPVGAAHLREDLRAHHGRRASGSSVLRQALFDWALGVGRERSPAEQARQSGAAPRSRRRASSPTSWSSSRIQQLLGGRCALMVSGGAPLAREIMEFFHAFGLLILEGYGLTETTPILTVNRPDHYKFGTVGPPIAGVTIADRAGRRDPRQGSERRAGLLQAAGGDGGGVGPERLVPHRRHRRVRRRRASCASPTARRT